MDVRSFWKYQPVYKHRCKHRHIRIRRYAKAFSGHITVKACNCTYHSRICIIHSFIRLSRIHSYLIDFLRINLHSGFKDSSHNLHMSKTHTLIISRNLVYLSAKFFGIYRCGHISAQSLHKIFYTCKP